VAAENQLGIREHKEENKESHPEGADCDPRPIYLNLTIDTADSLECGEDSSEGKKESSVDPDVVHDAKEEQAGQ